MNRFVFQLHISPEQYLDYYRGAVKQVLVSETSGQTIQFPAALLQKFVSPEGIHGRFVLTCNDQHKGAELRRLDAG